MRIIIDTNVVISGVFFGGYPYKVIESVITNKCKAFANLDIIKEYQEIVDKIVHKKGGTFDFSLFNFFIASLNIVKTVVDIDVCRDADDNKFIECAVDSGAMYIVSGDSDLLDLKEYSGIKIINAKDFCDKYL